MTWEARAVLLLIASAALGCDLTRSRPTFSRAEAPWQLLAANDSVAVSLDTANLIRAPDGALVVQLRYEFAKPVKVPRHPGRYAWRIESVERPQCDSLLTRPSALMMYDSIGREVFRLSLGPGEAAGARTGPMVRPVCRYLEKRGLLKAGV